MNQTALIVCHSFLQKETPQNRGALLAYLPADAAQEISDLPGTLGNPSLGLPRTQDVIDQVHYSWFDPFLRTQSQSDIHLFLSSLQEAQAGGLKKRLLFSHPLFPLSPLAQTFFKNKLFQYVSEKDLLPKECLPGNALNALLELNEQDLLALIDLLSMHDLAVEIRHIIDTQKLKKIYSLLSKPQQAYLKTLAHRKEAIAFKKLGLNNWNGDTEALSTTLHQRGLNRLAKALFIHHTSLAWYVSHRFDIDRGLRLIQLSSPLNHPDAGRLLTDQIIHLLQRNG